MATLDDAKQKLDELSAQVSTIVRTVAAGTLAVVWLFLSGGATSTPLLSKLPSWQLACIAILSILSIVFDLLQYVTAYNQVRQARTDAKTNNQTVVTYGDTQLKKWRYRFYRAKYYAAIAGAAWLVVLIGYAVFVVLTK